jgi:hypothetical protein
VDAMAYFRVHTGTTLQHVFDDYVDDNYKYKNLQEMLRKNIAQVCIETIRQDGSTLPPLALTKRASGCPKKVRIRKRSRRWTFEPEKSSIVCSRCHERGHNVRTCLERERRAAAREGGEQGSVANELDLSY